MTVFWLVLRVRWRRALAPSIAVALLIGGVGGFVLASAAAARRVDSAYGRFAAAIDAPDVGLIPGGVCEQPSGSGCDAPSASRNPEVDLATVRELPVVEKARLVTSFIPFLLDENRTPILGTADNVNGCSDGDRTVQMVATDPGGPKDQVVPFSLEGELPTPGSAKFTLSRATADRVGLQIGDQVQLAGWCDGGGTSNEFRAPITLTLSGISIGPLDVEAPGTGLTIHPSYVDPQVFEAIATSLEPQSNLIVWLDPDASSASVEEALRAYSIIFDFRDRKVVFDDALQTDANLLWLLAAVGAIGGLLVLAPVIARNLRDTGPNKQTLAAIGAQPRFITQQALVHSCSLAVIGALTAAVVAVPISAVMPNGLAAALEPRTEFWFDAMLTVIGVVLLAIVVVLIGAIPAWRIGRAVRTVASTESTGGLGAIGSIGLRPAARTGVTAAVGAPVGQRGSSPWPSLISMVVAAAVGVASLTYLAGLRHLERTPRLLGWNWDAAVNFNFEFLNQGDPTVSAGILAEMEQLDSVEQITGGTFYPPWFLFVPGSATFVWPWSFATGPQAVAPTMLTGRAPDGPDEVGIDEQFAQETGLGIGDTVSLARTTLIGLLTDQISQRIDELHLDYQLPEFGELVPVMQEFEITGVALLPGDPGQEITEVTLTLEGLAGLVEPTADEIAAALAWVPADLPPLLGSIVDQTVANLEIEGRAVYVRFTDGVFAGAQALAAMDSVNTPEILERGELPMEIVAPTPAQVMSLVVGLNIERNDRVPVSLAVMVAAAFFALVSYLLLVSIRARRFELAVMRALGLTTRDVRWSIAAQATATATVALLVAVPVGLLVGRWAWLNFARDLKVLPASVVPWSQIAVVAVAAIAMANAVALVPGWLATRRSVGFDLRSE